MKIVEPTVIVETEIDGNAVLKHLEKCGRTCYKSEAKATEDSAERFVEGLIKRGHESVLEHFSITVRIICDRGVSHEIVRHRLASYSQESQRYCNYQKDSFGNEISVIQPSTIETGTEKWKAWSLGCENAEYSYFRMLEEGATPQEARSVLPNSTKTELVMTANLREWRHFLKLRCAKAAHPDMRVIANKILDIFKAEMPWIFSDIVTED